MSFLVYRITPLAIEQAPPNWQLAAMGRFIPAHLPVLLPDPPAAAASGDGAAAPLGLAVEPNAFQPRQYGALYRLLHQHSQLLIQASGTAGVLGTRPPRVLLLAPNCSQAVCPCRQ